MQVGSLVEYFDDSKIPKWYLDNVILPKKSNLYIVRGFLQTGDEVGVYLEEIINDEFEFSNGYIAEPPFAIFRFREIQPPMKITEELFNYQTELV